jgi:6-phosphogluconolactonase
MTEIPFYIGSYSVASPWAGAPRAHGAGITRAAIDADSGSVEFGQSLKELNPSFLVRNDRQPLLWTISEAESGGDVIGYDQDAAGALTSTGRVATGADAPCHIAVDWDRRLAFASHYHGGVLALLSLGEGGEPQKSLSLAAPPSIARGENRGAAKSNVHASMRLGGDELLVTNTGRDLVLLYRIVGERSAASLNLLDALPLPLGTGPRHLALHAATGAIYVSNQNSGGVSVIAHTAGHDAPRLELAAMVASAGLGRDRCVPSEIAVHPTLGVVYMANRRDNSISVFSIESERGDLTLRDSVDVMGSNPRYFRVSPEGLWLIVANQDSDDLTVFRVEDGGRGLAYTGSRFEVATPTAICF